MLRSRPIRAPGFTKVLGHASSLWLLVWLVVVLIAPSSLCAAALSSAESLLAASRLTAEGDAFAIQGQEREAAKRYLAAHVALQRLLFDSFVGALYRSMKGEPDDESPMSRTIGAAAELRNLNLSKLWVVLDPDDRAFHLDLEQEREQMIARFPSFRTVEAAQALEDFLHRLYPDDLSGERQMEALRGETLPPSKRWLRLDRSLSSPQP